MGKAALRGRGCPAEPAGDWQQPSGPGASRLLGRGRWGGEGQRLSSDAALGSQRCSGGVLPAYAGLPGTCGIRDRLVPWSRGLSSEGGCTPWPPAASQGVSRVCGGPGGGPGLWSKSPRRLTQEDGKSEARLSVLVRACLKKIKKEL